MKCCILILSILSLLLNVYSDPIKPDISNLQEMINNEERIIKVRKIKNKEINSRKGKGKSNKEIIIKKDKGKISDMTNHFRLGSSTKEPRVNLQEMINNGKRITKLRK